MATTFDMPARPDAAAPAAKSPVRKPGRGPLLPILAVVAAGLAVGGYYATAGWRNAGDPAAKFLTEKVTKRNLQILVTEEGNVESAANVDLKCLVEGGSQIVWIVADGSAVKKGTKLCVLSSSSVSEKATQQKIAVERGKATAFQADQDHAVAVLAVNEYLEGTYVKELQSADSAIAVQEQNLKSAQNLLEHSETMFRKGHINQLQLDTNRDSVARCKLDLASAKTTRKVLVEFAKQKTLRQLESTRDASQAKLEAERQALKLEEMKLKRLEDQVANCTIVAPQDGTVIYANESDWRSGSVQIEEGALMKESQTIMRLPDLTKMQVKALVNEAKIGRLRSGMPAIVTIRDMKCRGEVGIIMSQADSTRRWMSAVKEYAAFVKIDESAGLKDLKPNMTAEVNILCNEVKDALCVPLQAIVEKGGRMLCYVVAPTDRRGYVERPVLLGDHTEKHAEIKDGVNEGELVILNPRANCPEANLDESAPEQASGLKMPPGVKGGKGKPGGKGMPPAAPNGPAAEAKPAPVPVGGAAGGSAKAAP